MTLRHTRETEHAVSFTGGDVRISFEAGERETDAYDEATEERAVELYDAVEYADDGRERESAPEREAEALGETATEPEELDETGPDVDATDEERTVEDEAAEAVEELEKADDVEVEVYADEDDEPDGD